MLFPSLCSIWTEFDLYLVPWSIILSCFFEFCFLHICIYHCKLPSKNQIFCSAKILVCHTFISLILRFFDTFWFLLWLIGYLRVYYLISIYFYIFSTFCLLFISSFIQSGLEKILSMSCVLKFVKTCFLSYHMVCPGECSVCLSINVCCTRYMDSISLFIFCLVDLFIAKSGKSKSSSIISVYFSFQIYVLQCRSMDF